MNGGIERRGRRRALPLLAIVAVLGLSGCTAGEATKAGDQGTPVTLRIGTDDGPGVISADLIEQFADQVSEHSDGQLRIEPAWHAAGDTGGDDWDQKVARLVMSGDLDLGLIPSRAWDTEGVQSLTALNTPMLVTSDALLGQVVTGELAPRLLAGLDTAGVHGLALVPEGIRRVFSFGAPMASAADFDGALIRAPASATTYAAFEALGATPGDTAAGDALMRAGKVAAAESSFDRAPTLAGGATVTVGNQPLWPKVETLVVNSEVMASLPERLQAVLQVAANATRDWAIRDTPTDAEAAVSYCSSGGSIVLATSHQVDDLRAALQPVVSRLRQDPETAGLIRDIEAMSEHAGATPAGLVTCAGRDPSDAASAPVSLPSTQSTDFPDGTYRATLTPQVFAAAGLSAEADGHAGVWTLTFDGGQLAINDVNDVTGISHTDRGVYCATGDRIALGLPGDALPGEEPRCGQFWTGRWRLAGDQLRFDEIRQPDDPIDQLLLEAIFGSTPFVRVE